jgi:hypothetical protein
MAKKKDPWKNITVIIEPPSDDVVNKARLVMHQMIKTRLTKKGEGK